MLEKTTDAVLAGSIAPSQANSVAQLAGVAMRLAELQVETQLAALELRLEEKKR